MRQGCQRAWPRVRVAFGFSIKASAGWRALWERPAPRQGYPVRQPPQVPPAVLWPWVPLSTGAVLTESLPPWGWLKVLGAWEGCSASPAP